MQVVPRRLLSRIVRPWVHLSLQASRAVVVCVGPGGFQFLLKTVAESESHWQLFHPRPSCASRMVLEVPRTSRPHYRSDNNLGKSGNQAPGSYLPTELFPEGSLGSTRQANLPPAPCPVSLGRWQGLNLA